MVILGHASFSFIDLDQDTWLIISISGKDLTLLGGDSSVSWNKNGHNSTSSFNTLREWGHIE